MLTEHFGTIIFCRISQDVGKLRYRIAQVVLYIYIYRIRFVVLNATFNNISELYIVAVSFIGGGYSLTNFFT
jgi:hypothetical protein